jgi:DNA-binding NarL/FixJ family response regulator
MGLITGLSSRVDPRAAYESLRERVAECVSDTGSAVLVGGGIASGKTHLHNQIVSHSAESGMLTLSATGAPDERGVQGGVIDQLLASQALPDGFSDRFTAILDNPMTRAEEDHLIGELCRALHRLARDNAILIAVDDLQFVDDYSIRLLLQLQRRTRSARLLMVLTHADGAHPESFTAQSHHQLRLAPMTIESIAETLGSTAKDLPAQVRDLSAGNPLLVSALIDDHRAGDGLGGESYAKAARTLLNRWGSPLREVAAAIAVLDTDASPTAVAVVGAVDPHDARQMIGILAECGMLDGGRFRHPRAATAILDGLGAEERTRLHLRAAEEKHRNTVAAGEIAAHLLAAGEVNGDWALPVLVDAAEHAALGDDVEFATGCLRLAGTAAETDEQRRAVDRLLAKVTWRVRPGGVAPYLTAVREEALDGALPAADAVALARHSLWHGDRELFLAALSTMDSAAVEPRLAAELTLGSLWHFGTTPGTINAAAGTDPWNHTVASLARVWQAGGSEATSLCAERILQNCRLSDTSLEALGTAILALVHDGRSDRAEGWCASLREEAELRGAVTWQAMLDGVWASILLRRGDVAGAVSRAQSAVDTLSARNWGVAVGSPLTTLLIAHTTNGAFKAAAEVLRHPVPEALFDTVGGVRYLRARGHFHLATNRTLAALTDFQQCHRLVRAWDIDVPALLPWRADLAEVNLRLGKPGVAADLAKQQLAMAEDTDAYARGSAYRILAFTGDPAERAGLLSRAADCFKTSGDRLELAKTLRALGQIPQRWDHAVAPKPRPKPTAMPAPRPMSAPLKPRPRPETAESTVLSEAELRVAQLAALGHTNRQIATTLFITVSTVEQHLTRVYRKLGVRGRTALPTDLATTSAG